MLVHSEKMKPKLVGHVGKIGARDCTVSAFWSQSIQSALKIGQVHPQLTIFGKMSALFQFPFD